MCSIVKRCKGNQALDALDDLFVNQYRLAEQCAALHNAVTNGGNLAQVADDTHFAVGQGVFHLLESGGVVLHGNLDVLGTAVSGLVTENAHFQTDALAVALAQHLLILHVNELVFQRRAARIDNQNFHSFYFLLLYVMKTDKSEMPEKAAAANDFFRTEKSAPSHC